MSAFQTNQLCDGTPEAVTYPTLTSETDRRVPSAPRWPHVLESLTLFALGDGLMTFAYSGNAGGKVRSKPRATCCEQTYPGARFLPDRTCGDPNPCTDACCLANGTCVDLYPDDCTTLGAAPVPGGTACTVPQACCFPNGRCADLDPFCCQAQGGSSIGPSTTCEGDADGDGVDAVCGDACPLDPNDDSDFDTVCDSLDLCPGQDDRIDADDNGIPDCLEIIPTVSSWGLVVLTLTLLTEWKIHFGARGSV